MLVPFSQVVMAAQAKSVTLADPTRLAVPWQKASRLSYASSHVLEGDVRILSCMCCSELAYSLEGS